MIENTTDAPAADRTPEHTADGSSIPTVMRAVVTDRYGPPEQLQVRSDVPVPEPAAGEVLLEVTGASTNALDWHLVTAMPFFTRFSTGLRRPRRSTPGNDVAGRVVAVGPDVTSPKVGDVVFGNCARGACAEYAIAPAKHLEPVPAGVDVGEAATVGVAAFTGLQAVRDQGAVRPGDRVLIIGSSSGVGVFAVQLAAALGAEVTALTSSGNIELVRSLGAHHVLDRTQVDIVDLVGSGEIEPFDVVLDLAGAQPLRTTIRALADDGRFVMVGGRKTGHLWPLLTYPALALRSRLSKRTISSFVASETPEDRRVLAEHLTDGTLRPVIGSTIGLDEVAAAIRSHGDRTAVAKILVRP